MIIEILAMFGLILCFAGHRLLKVLKKLSFCSAVLVHLYDSLFFPRLCCFFVDSSLVSLSCTLSLRSYLRQRFAVEVTEIKQVRCD